MRRLNRYLPSTKLILIFFLLLDFIQLIYFIRAVERRRLVIELHIHRDIHLD
jgi:hypothetical protein